jgi:predicted RecA/RadA family phage recombinase
MALTADANMVFEIGPINTLPVVASGTIYKGSAVGNSSGYARALTAGDSFRGFADAKVDNSDGAAGVKNVDVITEGYAQITLSGIAITDVGKPVYMSADDTFTLTQGSNSLVGYVYRYVTTDTCVIVFGINPTLQASAVETTAVTPVGTTVATTTTPYGFTTQAQADAIVASLNSVISRQASIITAINAMLSGLKG